MENTSFSEQPFRSPESPSPGLFDRNRNLIKGLLISFLILMLLIPTFFIGQLIRERRSRNEEVKREIASQWSGKQELAGPLLVIPYLVSERSTDGKLLTTRRQAYFLPEQLNLKAKLDHDFRARSSIFKLIVYTAHIEIQGSFNSPALSKLNLLPENMLPEEAFLLFSLSDYTGIQDQIKMQWDQQTLEFSAGTNSASYADKGLFALLPMNREQLTQSHHFTMKLDLRGSEQIGFCPLGKTTAVQVESAWPHPDFQGKTLPTKNINTQGFTAQWKALDLNRSFPQQWRGGEEINFSESSFGVNLLQPLDNYARTDRTIKYAILVIMLTFVVYFFIEVLQKKRVHAVQYVLIGFALCIFYTLLLSISEYTSFSMAYSISALATILLIGIYTGSVFASRKTAFIFGSFQSLLYLFIFILIQLQDGALLAGSIGLFLILACIMYFSRRIEWYK